ncbi:MAG: geranylgeranylglycerol-phosphate geranylgeranyltransferase [Candidatus Bathyarchaeia archaeon]
MVMQRLDAMKKISGYLRLIRPVNCLMMGFAVIVGAALANPHVLDGKWQMLACGFVAGFMLTAASMAINDYYDREIDAVNEPNRPIPSGTVKPKEALIFASVLTIIGFASAYLTNYACFFTALLAWIIFVTYTTVGKRSGLPGNFLVSTCVAIPFIYGSLAVTGEVMFNVLVFVSMVFLSNTGREITKGIVDVQGDEAKGVKTLAVRYGARKAAWAASLFYVSAVALSPLPPLLMSISFWFIPLVAVTDFGLLVSSTMLLRDYSRENARKIKDAVLLWFVAGLLAFLVGALG